MKEKQQWYSQIFLEHGEDGSVHGCCILLKGALSSRIFQKTGKTSTLHNNA